ncbi:serine hydrolase domain-containing protein [Alteribacter natronophilus]|uniref:serine hydrolase domain-containing protein n=1 Tax=Alteribacter natronophilus TaxID=2583810 RepID=UPI00110DBDEC|nr:serine hydrolase [Alteribacter natronophilus]TMW73455.1 serine hydrolase [Alteribacter natronophilus]
MSYSPFVDRMDERSFKGKEELEEILASEPVSSCAVSAADQLVFRWTGRGMELDTPVKVNSVTKSVLSALTGIASSRGEIDLNRPVSDYLAGKDIPAHFSNITIDHLLLMSSGLRWPGNKAFFDSGNWLSFILGQNSQDRPGEKMSYIEACSHLLSIILTEATGRPLSLYAAEHLFKPLDIPARQWDTDPQGYNTGGFGLSLSPLDMLKFGRLYVNKGCFNGKTVVQEEWAASSTERGIKTGRGHQWYGRHWWINPESGRLPEFPYAAGSGGQYIFILPEKELICVFTGRYSRKEAVKPFTYFTKFILTAFE